MPGAYLLLSYYWNWWRGQPSVRVPRFWADIAKQSCGFVFNLFSVTRLCGCRRASHNSEPTVLSLPFVLDDEAHPAQFVDPGVVLGDAKFKNFWKRNPGAAGIDEQLQNASALR